MEKDVEKIVKALRYCDSDDWTDCKKCVRFGERCEEHRSVDADAADMIERLSVELAQVKRERDAAVNELAGLEKLIAPSAEMCSICKYAHYEAKIEPCASCEPSHERSKWEWRGAVKENCGGAE